MILKIYDLPLLLNDDDDYKMCITLVFFNLKHSKF